MPTITGMKTLRIAVLILPPIQLLDLSPVDLFHMLSKQYLRDCNLPGPLLELGLDEVRIHYVAESGPPTASTSPSSTAAVTTTATTVVETTASLAIRVTHDLSHPDVQPGAVDVLLVPGPDPNQTFSASVKGFIGAHASPEAGTTVMSVCTGVIPLAHAGMLDGRVCTGPRALLGMFLRKDFPRAKWVEKRWVADVPAVGGGGGKGGKGELWTAGGITNGQDMVAAYIRTKYDSKLSDLICAMADVGGRGQEYTTGAAVEGLWWGRLLLRSWFAGLFGGKKT